MKVADAYGSNACMFAQCEFMNDGYPIWSSHTYDVIVFIGKPDKERLADAFKKADMEKWIKEYSIAEVDKSQTLVPKHVSKWLKDNGPEALYFYRWKNKPEF